MKTIDQLWGQLVSLRLDRQGKEQEVTALRKQEMDLMLAIQDRCEIVSPAHAMLACEVMQ